MTTSLAHPARIVEQKADGAAEAEVDRLCALAERAALQCEPKDAARTYLGLAGLKSRNAGLDKRHATKVSLQKSVEEWLDE